MAAQGGRGALHYAAEKGQPEVAQRLLAGGANPNLQNEVSRGDGRGGVCDTGWECRGEWGCVRRLGEVGCLFVVFGQMG